MTGTDVDTTKQTGEKRLSISASCLAEMLEHVQRWYPMEGCGLLATQGEQVVRVYPGTNVARSETFYEMDPREVLAAQKEIDDRGEQLGAIFHSHPSTGAWPSPTDLELIFDPAVFMIIISLATETPDIRAFRYEGEIIEVPIVVSQPPDEGASG